VRVQIERPLMTHPWKGWINRPISSYTVVWTVKKKGQCRSHTSHLFCVIGGDFLLVSACLVGKVSLCVGIMDSGVDLNHSPSPTLTMSSELVPIRGHGPAPAPTIRPLVVSTCFAIASTLYNCHKQCKYIGHQCIHKEIHNKMYTSHRAHSFTLGKKSYWVCMKNFWNFMTNRDAG